MTRINAIYEYTVRLRTIAMVGCLTVLASCASDHILPPEELPDTDKELTPEVSFFVRVPSYFRHNADTRAGETLLPFDSDRESRIGEASVVLFTRDADGNSDRVEAVLDGKRLQRDETNTSVYSFKVSYYPLLTGEALDSYNAVVLANCRDEAALVRRGMTMEQARKALVRKFNSTKAPFIPELPKNDSVPLPMWGEIDGVRFPSEVEEPGQTYATSLLRSVARVDITVDDDNISPDKLRIESIHLVNGANACALMPDKQTLSPVENLEGHFHATAPTLPDGVGYSIRWDHDSVAKNNNISYTLYMPESDVVMDSIYPGDCHTKRTAIVVGAHYEGSDSLQYYRIDFIDDETGELINVRRNHLYTFRIAQVDREGAESVAAAYSDPVARLGSSLIEWDLPHHAITYLGDDWISASKELLHLAGREGAGAVIDVESSLPLSTLRVRWTENEDQTYHTDLTESVNGVEATVKVNGDKGKVIVEVTEDNPPGAEPRVGNLAVRISAGLRINIPVMIHPLDDNEWDPSDPIDVDLDGVKDEYKKQE